MIRIVLLVIALAALMALIWWSAGLPDKGEGAPLVRKARRYGGWFNGSTGL
jgi:hypothetical protein